MRILIAGGTGVLGRRVVPLLLAAGHDVTVLARNPQRAAAVLPPLATVVAADALDPGAVAAAVRGATPDLVMHQLTDLSGGSAAANARLRVDGTRNLVDAALAAGVERFVAQSIAWCYEPGAGPADEAVPLDAVSTNPARRVTVDAVVSLETETARLPRGVVLRNGLLYGPGTWYSPGGSFGEAARAGKLTADADVASFVHVDDAAAASVLAIDWPAGVVNVVDDEPAPGPAWAPVFCAAVGAPPPPAGSSERQPWARGAVNRWARELGWVPGYSSWRTGFSAG
jgi:nucleoside-diphosphate-sugar epimerase